MNHLTDRHGAQITGGDCLRGLALSLALVGLAAGPGCRRESEPATSKARAGLTPTSATTGPDTQPAQHDVPQERRPNVLLVTFDTLRADHCSLYGYARKTTPQMERLAPGSVVFRQAYAPTATTAPSHVTIFTGLYPYSHGVLKNGYRVADGDVMIAEIFKKLGYHTAGFASSLLLKDGMGYGQGYDKYVFGAQNQRTADVTVHDAIQWMDEQTDPDRDPIFMWVHLRDPHEPYDAPAEFGDPFGYQKMEYASYDQMVARYDTEIAFSDHHLGRLVDRFEALDGTDGALVVITADHGEEFLEHGWRGHGAQIYEPTVHIPLIMRWTGHLQPRSVDMYVGLVDILPTMLSLMGSLPPKHLFQGQDLSPLVRGDTAGDPQRYLFFQRRPYEKPGVLKAKKLGEFDQVPKPVVFGKGIYVAGDKYAVRQGPWKYLEALEEDVKHELYDLEADPVEKHNVAAEHPDMVARFSSRIAQWRRTTVSHSIAPARQDLTPDQLKALQGLGYFEPGAEDDEGEYAGEGTVAGADEDASADKAGDRVGKAKGKAKGKDQGQGKGKGKKGKKSKKGPKNKTEENPGDDE